VQVTGYDKLLVALFVVSYQLIVAFILCNIVMAVLLDKFSEASEASKAEDAEVLEIEVDLDDVAI
jgi:hypothetical protein